jgi:hypothetical protein
MSTGFGHAVDQTAAESGGEDWLTSSRGRRIGILVVAYDAVFSQALERRLVGPCVAPEKIYPRPAGSAGDRWSPRRSVVRYARRLPRECRPRRRSADRITPDKNFGLLMRIDRREVRQQRLSVQPYFNRSKCRV